MRTDTSEAPRIPSLDGVRAVAITLVLIGHYLGHQDLVALLGVKVFLVLSGFLITQLLVAEFRTCGRIDFARFYAAALCASSRRTTSFSASLS